MQSSINSTKRKEIKIPKNFVGMRIDAALSEILENYSRAQIIKIIKKGHVLINGLSVKPSRILSGGEDIVVELPLITKTTHPEPEDIILDLIYEDEDLIVINKPPGMVVHPGSGVNGSTLVNSLVFHYPEISCVGETNRPGIVHRLDKETSGVMIVARNELSYKKLVEQFKNRKVKKEYLAIICGAPSRDSGEFCSYLGRHKSNRIKISSFTNSGKEARTEWSVDKRYGELTLVKAYPRTGRTHQIRVHFSEAGLPLLGDKLYGSKRYAAFARDFDLKRHALHASGIRFVHPGKGNIIEFSAPMPDDMKRVIKAYNNKRIENEDI